MDGRVAKIAKERALLEQPFFKDTGKSVAEHIKAAVAAIGENIQARRRFCETLRCCVPREASGDDSCAPRRSDSVKLAAVIARGWPHAASQPEPALLYLCVAWTVLRLQELSKCADERCRP